MEDLAWIYLAVVRDRWRVVVSMVMKLGHLSNCQLIEPNSDPWSYLTLPWENRCRTWRHTQHAPEHAEGLPGHTERLQQCLLVSKQDSFSEILQEAFRSPPIQDWYSATRGMLITIFNFLRQIACKNWKPCCTHRDANLGLLFDQFLAQPFGQNGNGVFCRTVHAEVGDRGYVTTNTRNRKWSCTVTHRSS